MTNFISSREKLHCSAQELHTIHKIASNYNKQQHNERQYVRQDITKDSTHDWYLNYIIFWLAPMFLSLCMQ